MKKFPKQIRVGDTLKVELSISPYTTTDGFSLEVTLNGPEEHIFGDGSPSFVTATDDTTFELLIPHTTTADLAPGFYNYQIAAVSETERYTVEDGTTEVKALNELSHERKVLNAINAILENKATLEQQSYTIAGRTLARQSITDLLQLKNHYEDLVRRKEGPRTRTKLQRVWNIR